MNIFTFTGRIGRDAEQRYTQSGAAMVSFPVANDTGYGDNKKTTWIRCTIWGKKAEGKLIDYLKKGQEVAVSGECGLNEYQAKDGTNKASIEVNVREVDLVGSKPKPSQPSAQQPEQPAAQGDDFSDDIPFMRLSSHPAV